MWRCPIFRSRDWQFQDVSVNERNGENSLSPKASCPLHQWLAATSFCSIEFLSVSPPGGPPVDLCCLAGLSASGTHTLQLQISSGRLKPTRFQLFLIAAFAVNVLLSQGNDPFFPQPRSRWGGLPGHGGEWLRGQRWAAACTPDGRGRACCFGTFILQIAF